MLVDFTVENYRSMLTEQAIKRAEKIANQIERNELYEHSNPCCSGLAKLISSLLTLENS